VEWEVEWEVRRGEGGREGGRVMSRPVVTAHQQSQSQAQPLFSVEDTADLCYRDVISALERRNWLPTSSGGAERVRKSTKFEKKLPIMRANQRPRFVWTISERAMDFDSLHPSQLVNHFEGISALTTKNGVCDLLREMAWIGRDHRDVSPR
jgi:hypothetical protein